MEIGKTIKTRRKELGLTQEELAEKVHVTPQAVSQWENGKTNPDIFMIKPLAEVLKLDKAGLISGELREKPSWLIREKLYSEENMYRKLKEFAKAEGLSETDRAIDYAKKMHEGQERKTGEFSVKGVPYIVHPFNMACQAHALGIRDDRVLAAVLLHDVCEERKMDPEKLPFSERVREIVALLTKKKGEESRDYTKQYYEGIASDPDAAIIKLIDRCNNVSTMMQGFKWEKIIDYVYETEEFTLPLVDVIKEQYRQYYDVAFILKYQILSLIESIKITMIRW